MPDNNVLVIGKIIGIHGLRGIIKVYSYSGSMASFEPGKQIIIADINDNQKKYTIKTIRPHKKIFLLSLNGIENIDSAKNFVGSKILFEKKSLPDLNEGTFYWNDIIGLNVYAMDESYIGVVDSIIETGSNDVYVVKNNDKEILIPAIESVVISINIKHQKMQVNLPEGL